MTLLVLVLWKWALHCFQNMIRKARERRIDDEQRSCVKKVEIGWV